MSEWATYTISEACKRFSSGKGIAASQIFEDAIQILIILKGNAQLLVVKALIVVIRNIFVAKHI